MLTPHGDPLGRIGEPDIGGQCVYIRELTKHLSLNGISVKVFTRDRGEGKPKTESFAKSAVVIRISCGPEEFVPKEEILPLLGDFADGVSEHIHGSEILHSHYWDGGHVASLLHDRQPWFHSTHSLGKVKQMSLPDFSRYQYEDRIRIEENVSEAETGSALIAVNDNLGQFRAGSATFECDFESVTVDVASQIFLDVDRPDANRVSRKQASRFHGFETTAS